MRKIKVIILEKHKILGHIEKDVVDGQINFDRFTYDESQLGDDEWFTLDLPHFMEKYHPDLVHKILDETVNHPDFQSSTETPT